MLRRSGLVASLVLALLGAALAAPSSASTPPDTDTPVPMIWQREFADPSVVEYYDGYLAVGTGPVMPRVRSGGSRGPWHELPSPLTALPAWAIPGDLWAPHLQRVGDGSWVLYYSALAPDGGP